MGENIKTTKVSVDFYQPSDSCQTNDPGQTLTIETDNAGEGPFIVLKTEYWSLDDDELDTVARLAEYVLKIANTNPLTPKKKRAKVQT
jgi:hypothetical protein